MPIIALNQSLNEAPTHCTSIRWGRLIFHISDVDRFWAYLMEKGFHPESPQDASWGEGYFHLPDPDGHELSFARPI